MNVTLIKDLKIILLNILNGKQMKNYKHICK